MKNNYLVSIIVPIYNVEDYIERCLVSLFEQDFDNIEYIFVNDSSPDKSVEILEKTIEKYSHRKPHCKIITHQQNQGSGFARNTGLKNASGEYVLQVDPDDWIKLDTVSTIYKKAKDDNADIVCFSYVYVYKYGQVECKFNVHNEIENNIIDLLNAKYPGSLCNKLIKLSLYKKVDYVDTDLHMGEDVHANLKMLLVPNVKVVQERNGYYYYYQGNTQSQVYSYSEKQVLSHFKMLIKIHDLLKDNRVLKKYIDAFYALAINSLQFYIYRNKDKQLLKQYPKAFSLKYVTRKSSSSYKVYLARKIILILYKLKLKRLCREFVKFYMKVRR